VLAGKRICRQGIINENKSKEAVMHNRRALLYMPGDEMHKIQKAASVGVDCACLDLEDAVVLDRKETARQVTSGAVQNLEFGETERLVRINPIFSGLAEADLASILPAHPDGIVLPKLHTAEEIKALDQNITAFEEKSHWPTGGIAILAIIETALAVIHLEEICSASPRLQALIFGAEDLAGDIGAVRTPSGSEVFMARSLVVLHAAAHQLQAIDLVNVNFKELESLHAEARQGAKMGFTGKQIIHPRQVSIVQEAFTPEPAEIQHAQRILNAYAVNKAAGSGAFALDGQMVDLPVVKAAERVLERAGLIK
jgi:citrate lyase beta subunit